MAYSRPFFLFLEIPHFMFPPFTAHAHPASPLQLAGPSGIYRDYVQLSGYMAWEQTVWVDLQPEGWSREVRNEWVASRLEQISELYREFQEAFTRQQSLFNLKEKECRLQLKRKGNRVRLLCHQKERIFNDLILLRQQKKTQALESAWVLQQLSWLQRHIIDRWNPPPLTASLGASCPSTLTNLLRQFQLFIDEIALNNLLLQIEEVSLKERIEAAE